MKKVENKDYPVRVRQKDFTVDGTFSVNKFTAKVKDIDNPSVLGVPVFIKANGSAILTDEIAMDIKKRYPWVKVSEYKPSKTSSPTKTNENKKK